MKTISNFFKKTWPYAKAHKIISAIILVLFFGGGWYAYAASNSTIGETHYILGTTSTSTIIATVSGSGQISSSDSVDVKPQVTGTITWVGVQEGDHVHAGQALMSIDGTSARQQVDDDKAALATAELQYQQDSAAAPINYQKDQTAVANAESDLTDEYSNAFSTLGSAYLDEPAAVTGIQNILYGYDLSPSNSQWNVDALTSMFSNRSDQLNQAQTFATSAKNDYQSARGLYDPALLAYKALTRTSSQGNIDSSLAQSITATAALAQAAQSELNFLSEVNDLSTADNTKMPSTFATMQTNIKSYLSTLNNDLSELNAEKKALSNAKQTVTTDQQNVQLDQVGNTGGSNPISLQISANNIQKQKQDLATEETNLSHYTIVAPFDGTVSAVDLKVGDQAGSAAAATVLADQNIAELSLNEVDAAKVQVGQKATLTFDAITDLTLTGTVAEVDTAGTVSQGVVSYGVKISLDSQDSRIKSGMTVNADIQTAVHQDVLSVPSSAIKTIGGASFVQAFIPPLTNTDGTQGVTSTILPQNIPVTTGISDDTNVEILSGLTAGEQIVTRTTNSKTTTTSAAATGRTTTGAAGARGGFGGGGAIRIGG